VNSIGIQFQLDHFEELPMKALHQSDKVEISGLHEFLAK
jgi:hypothetical protein